jgi:hypothetical protein
MHDRKIRLLLLFCVALMLYSCVSTNISKYYTEHSMTLDSIDQAYRSIYRQRPFSLLFTDKSFKHISLEINTDTIKYIYEFGLTEKRLRDSIEKYELSVTKVESLLNAMKSIKCLWVGNLDYYVDGKRNSLVCISIRSKSFRFPLLDKRYYILTYYSQPQYYDSEGRLLDHRRRRQLRRINKEIFRRINDKVCYTVSNVFR